MSKLLTAARTTQTRWRIAAVALASFVFLPLRLIGDSVPVTNADFESVPEGIGDVPGWTVGAGEVASEVTVPIGRQVPVPRISSVLILSTAGSVSQTLSRPLQAGFMYRLTVDVGWVNGQPEGDYSVALTAGGQTLAEASPALSERGLVTAEVDYQPDLTDPLIGQPLAIVLSIPAGSLGSVEFDNVQLEATAMSPPVIVASPESQGVYFGGVAALSVTASGQGPFTYQWMHGVTFLTGANLSSLQIANFSEELAGDYAVIVSNKFGSATSSVATLTLVAFSPQIHNVPGVIQAEDFDDGGEGVGYHATSVGNAGGAYRHTDVDIYPTTDTNGVFDVSLSAGEWLRYTVVVAQSGAYRVDLRFPADDPLSGIVQLSVDGARATGPMMVPWTGPPSGSDWQTITVEPIILSAGQHFLQMSRVDAAFQNGRGMRFNYLQVTSAALRPAVIVAGTGVPGFADGAANQAQFSTNITGLDSDAQGNIYVADAGNLRLRKVSPTGQVTTLAGNGTAGQQNGPGDQAQFLTMNGVAVDSEGNCYVGEIDSAGHTNRVRKVTPEGTVSTFYEESHNQLPYTSSDQTLTSVGVDGSGRIVFSTLESGSQLSTLIAISQGSRSVLKADTMSGSGGFEIVGAVTCGHSTNINYLEFDYSEAAYPNVNTWTLNSRTPSGSENSLVLRSCNCNGFPTGLAVSSAGELYVGLDGGIQRVLSDASAQWVNPGPGFTGPLTADYGGNVYGFQNNKLYEVLLNYPAVALSLFTEGGGAVVASPQGSYLSNAVAQITATPSEGLEFLHWQGDVMATNSQVNIRMDTHKTIEAIFGAQVDVGSNPGGTVTREPDLTAYPFNSQVTLTAQPDTGFEFLHWSDGDTNKVRAITVTAGMTLQAMFSALPQFTLRAEALLGIGGTVTAVPAQATYFRDTQVTLYARPATGYVFQTWLDGDLSDPRIITMESNTTVFAGFAPGQGTPASIITPPKDVTAAAGDKVTFNVTATGSALVEYQWSHDGKPILGETHTTLSLPGVQALDAGTYSVKVYNSVDSANASAILSIISGSRPLITSVQQLNGQIQFTMSGTTGQQYKLESSPDLSTWTPATTLTNTQGTVSYSATMGGGNLFYRASVVQ